MSDPFSSENIDATLIQLTNDLYESDMRIANTEQVLAEQAESVELVEVNVSLNTEYGEKDTAPTREQKRKQAVLKSQEVKSVKADASKAQINLDEEKANNKKLARQFAAACHIAERQAARMNLMSTKGATP